ncbi:hypothetical protein CH362_07745 [Leptospira saintgironsiae]|uniref:Uncharacterized protein n=1 Tax=Leptospira saintgironsiae TaxID=2023183 RepID=A0A2M9YCS2_9LEPT|nr:hypothetical protein CH362_07745 [Leptospira saintgironsiae]
MGIRLSFRFDQLHRSLLSGHILFVSYGYIRPQNSTLYLNEFSFIKNARVLGLDVLAPSSTRAPQAALVRIGGKERAPSGQRIAQMITAPKFSKPPKLNCHNRIYDCRNGSSRLT